MFKDMYYMLASSLLRFLTGVAVFVILARAWGVKEFGAFMYCYTISMLAVILVEYGFSLQVVRDVAREPERVKEIVGRAFTVKTLLTAALLLMTAAAIPIMHLHGRLVTLIWLLLGAAIASSFGMLFNLPFRGLGRFRIETRVVMISNLVLLIIVLALVFMGFGLVPVACGFLLSRLLYFALSWNAYARYTGGFELPRADGRQVLSSLRTGLPFGVHVALATLYFQVDTLLIHHFLGAEGVGIYQAGIRIVMAGLILADVLTNVYLPRLSMSESRAGLVEIGTRMTRHLVFIGAIGSTVMVIFAEWIVQLLYGKGYSLVAHFLPLLAVVFFLRYFAASHGCLLTVANRQVIRAIGVSIALVSNITLNLVLIPRLGLMGAVYTSIITHVVLDAIYVLFAWRQVRSLMIEWRVTLMLALILLGNLGALTLPLGLDWVKIAYTATVVGLIALLGIEGREWRSLYRRIFRESPAFAS